MTAAREPNRRGEGDRLRGELVAAATELLTAPRPVPSPSLRAVARRCGVAPSAVYAHFASGEALTAAVVEEQFDRLRAHLQRAAGAAPADPLGRIRALARAYFAWGTAHPGCYQLLFEGEDLEQWPAGEGPGVDLLDVVVGELRRLGRTRRDAEHRSRVLWSALHGVTSLRIHKEHAPWTRAPQRDVDALVDAVTAG